MKIREYKASVTPENLRLSDDQLVFGKKFTDRIFKMNWSEEKGWHKPRIASFRDISLSPAARVLHYGQEVFEGMKAYYLGDKEFGLFRPEENIARFNRSAKRMVMPEIDPEFFMQALTRLISLEFDWIPKTRGCALYIRPNMIAIEPCISVGPSLEYLFYIMFSPVGPYFKSGFNPVKIYVPENFSRAADGGVGDAKTSGNYAASLYASQIAKEHDCSQVLWLDASQHKYVEEVGAMNMFFVRDGDTLVTPPLGGTILPGVTRDSVIKLAGTLGYKVEETVLPIDYVTMGIKTGSITEAFGSGTAAVVTPVGELCYGGHNYVINNGEVGPVTKRLFDELTAIQYGEKNDDFGWFKRFKVDEE